MQNRTEPTIVQIPSRTDQRKVLTPCRRHRPPESDFVTSPAPFAIDSIG